MTETREDRESTSLRQTMPVIVQELAETIAKREAERDTLAAQVATLQGAIAAQDERERLAGDRCGVSALMHGCDWPDAVAERVATLTAGLQELKSGIELARFSSEADEARMTTLTAEVERLELALHHKTEEANIQRSRADQIQSGAQVTASKLEAAEARVTALEAGKNPEVCGAERCVCGHFGCRHQHRHPSDRGLAFGCDLCTCQDFLAALTAPKEPGQ